MNSVTRKRLIATFAAAVLAVGTMTGCPSPSNSQPSNQAPASEQEDCDFGDRLEGDSDCDDEGGHSKTKKKSKPKATKPRTGFYGGGGGKATSGSKATPAKPGSGLFGGSKSSPRKSGRR